MSSCDNASTTKSNVISVEETAADSVAQALKERAFSLQKQLADGTANKGIVLVKDLVYKTQTDGNKKVLVADKLFTGTAISYHTNGNIFTEKNYQSALIQSLKVIFQGVR